MMRAYWLLPVALLLVGCDPETRQEILNVLFESLPEKPKSDKAEVKQGQLKDDPEPEAIATGSRHRPYVERDCQSCHAAGDIMPRPELCRNCHDGKGKWQLRDSAIVIRDGVYFHDPVAGDLCRECHVAHQSPFPYLLKQQPAARLCLECHDSLRAQFAGQNMDCTACHNPHYAETKETRLLKKQLPALCLDCHQVPEEDYWLHGPYALGKCDICHAHHGSPHPSQLVEESVARLCQGCHDLQPQEPHHQDLTRNCTDCHNPHYGRISKDLLLQERSNAKPMLLLHDEYGLKREAEKPR